MSDAVLWAILAGVLVILELFTGTFYLLMVAIGMIAGAGAAQAGASGTVQLLMAAGVGIIATGILRASRFGKMHRTDAARDPNVNPDIGNILNVDSWTEQPGGHYIARIMYRGALWDIELVKGEAPEPGRFAICEVRGNRLFVKSHN